LRTVAAERIARTAAGAQADALFLDVDVEHPRLDGLALGIARWLLQRPVQSMSLRAPCRRCRCRAHEQDETRWHSDLALPRPNHRVLFEEQFPRIAHRLLEAEADAALGGVGRTAPPPRLLGGGDDLPGDEVLLRQSSPRVDRPSTPVSSSRRRRKSVCWLIRTSEIGARRILAIRRRPTGRT